MEDKKNILRRAFSECGRCNEPEFVIKRNRNITFSGCDEHDNGVLVATEGDDEIAMEQHKERELTTLVSELVSSQQDYCKYGCGAYSTLREIQDHQQQCSKRVERALCYIANCDYEGCNKSLIQHVSDEHPEQLILLQEVYEEKIDIGFPDPIKLMLLFEIDYPTNEMYWIRLYEDQDQRFIMVQYHGRCGYDVPRTHDWQIVLEAQNLLLKLDVTKLLIESRDNEVLDNVMKRDGTNISMLPGREYILQMHRKDQVALPGNVIQAMECIVCKDVMGAPIIMCSTGHSMCKACRLKLTQCPLCKREFAITRNYALEAASTQMLRYCCHYDARYDVGCRERMNTCDLVEHADICLFRTVVCPFSTRNLEPICKSGKIIYKYLFSHIETCHKFSIIINGVKTMLSKIESKVCRNTSIMNEFGNVFVFSIDVDETEIGCTVDHLVIDESNFNVELKFFADEKILWTSVSPCTKIFKELKYLDYSQDYSIKLFKINASHVSFTVSKSL